jgi:hypothetical protein
MQSNLDLKLPEIVFRLQGIHPVSIPASLSLFARTNHKDRYAALIAFLRSTPDVFRQMVYLAYTMSANRAISWKAHHSFSSDDITFSVSRRSPQFSTFF